MSRNGTSLMDGRDLSGRPPDAYPNPGPLWDGIDYPGDGGYPPNPGEARPGLSAFGRLAKGQPLGKSSIIRYNALRDGLQSADTEMLRIEGDDLDTCQLLVTIAPPRVIPTAFADLLDSLQSDPSMSQTNSEITVGDFPGEGAPIKWPALEAVVKFGIKGMQSEVVVDIANGTTFSCVASFVSVHAMIAQGESVDVAGTSAAYQCAASVGPGIAFANPKRTIFVGVVLDSTSSDVFDVPKLARRAVVVGASNGVEPALTAATIRFWQSPEGQPSGTGVGDYFQAGNQPIAFDVPNGGQYFSLFNQSGVAMKMCVVFELALQ